MPAGKKKSSESATKKAGEAGNQAMATGKCVSCGKVASLRCSQCRVLWYCGPECQKKHWVAGHKRVCVELKNMGVSATAVNPHFEITLKNPVAKIHAAMEALSDGAQKVTCVDLSYQTIDRGLLTSFFSSLRRVTTLLVLLLPGLNLDDDLATALSVGLTPDYSMDSPNGPSVTYLDLKENCIGSEGALALAECLKINSQLTSLDLRYNDLGSVGGKALAEAVRVNATLNTLQLGSCGLTDDGMNAIGEALGENMHLRLLAMDHNAGTANSVDALAESLKKNKILTSLDVKDQPLGNAGALALARALKSSSACLKSLNLKNTGLSNDAAIALAAMTRTSRSLTELDVSLNNVEGAALEDVISAGESRSQLRVFAVYGPSPLRQSLPNPAPSPMSADMPTGGMEGFNSPTARSMNAISDGMNNLQPGGATGGSLVDIDSVDEESAASMILQVLENDVAATRDKAFEQLHLMLYRYNRSGEDRTLDTNVALHSTPPALAQLAARSEQLGVILKDGKGLRRYMAAELVVHLLESKHVACHQRAVSAGLLQILMDAALASPHNNCLHNALIKGCISILEGPSEMLRTTLLSDAGLIDKVVSVFESKSTASYMGHFTVLANELRGAAITHADVRAIILENKAWRRLVATELSTINLTNDRQLGGPTPYVSQQPDRGVPGLAGLLASLSGMRY